MLLKFLLNVVDEFQNIRKKKLVLNRLTARLKRGNACALLWSHLLVEHHTVFYQRNLISLDIEAYKGQSSDRPYSVVLGVYHVL